jgi:hypothetical protein
VKNDFHHQGVEHQKEDEEREQLGEYSGSHRTTALSYQLSAFLLENRQLRLSARYEVV